MTLLTKDDYIVSRWSGGTTTQIAIMPPDASYTDRSFLWRLSSAMVEDEESDFTALPDYDRWLLLLEGSLDITHDNSSAVRLMPYEAHAFDGGSRTRAKGRCTDFNLMLRKGKSCGTVCPLRLSGQGEREVRFGNPPRNGLSNRAVLLFCGGGEGVVESLEGRAEITEGESVFLENALPFTLKISVPGPADFVVAEIWYGDCLPEG